MYNTLCIPRQAGSLLVPIISISLHLRLLWRMWSLRGVAWPLVVEKSQSWWKLVKASLKVCAVSTWSCNVRNEYKLQSTNIPRIWTQTLNMLLMRERQATRPKHGKKAHFHGHLTTKRTFPLRQHSLSAFCTSNNDNH